MSYQGQTWVDSVALPQLKNGGELLVMLRVANHAGNGPTKMSGCHAAAKTLATECLMGRSTVLRHLRELVRRGLLVPGDPALVDHLPSDKRPPVYDLGGAHEPGCIGGHTHFAECQRAGVQIEHPQKKTRSAGVQSEHPQPDEGGAGVQIETERVFKSSTNSSKELKVSSPPGRAPSQASPPPPANRGGEREEAGQEQPPGVAEAGGSPSAPLRAPDGENGPQSGPEQVLAAYEQAIGGKALNGTRAKILADAGELLDARPLWWVIDRARELPKYGTDLAKHASMSKAPFTRSEPRRGLPWDSEAPAEYTGKVRMADVLASIRQPSI